MKGWSIVTGIRGDATSYEWNVGQVLQGVSPPDGSYVVSVTGIDEQGERTGDISDAPFSIVSEEKSAALPSARDQVASLLVSLQALLEQISRTLLGQ